MTLEIRIGKIVREKCWCKCKRLEKNNLVLELYKTCAESPHCYDRIG